MADFYLQNLFALDGDLNFIRGAANPRVSPRPTSPVFVREVEGQGSRNTEYLISWLYWILSVRKDGKYNGIPLGGNGRQARRGDANEVREVLLAKHIECMHQMLARGVFDLKLVWVAKLAKGNPLWVRSGYFREDREKTQSYVTKTCMAWGYFIPDVERDESGAQYVFFFSECPRLTHAKVPAHLRPAHCRVHRRRHDCAVRKTGWVGGSPRGGSYSSFPNT